VTILQHLDQSGKILKEIKDQPLIKYSTV